MKRYYPSNKVNNNIDFNLSILIPMHNSSESIVKCLNSIINYDTKYSVEVVIVNDGSTDNSVDLVDKIKNDNKNSNITINLINQTNHGIGYTRNTLLENANGEYISFLDSDDYLGEHFIEIMMNDIKYNNVEYVKCNYIKKSSEGKELFKTNYLNDYRLEQIDGYLWGAIIKKSLYQDISFPDNMWFEDMINGLIIIPRVKSFFIEEKYLYNYIDYPLSASKIEGKKNNIKNLDQYYMVSSILQYYVEKKTLSKKIYKKIINEYGVMLCMRTRKLNKNIRYAYFLKSCNDLREIINLFKDKSIISFAFKHKLYNLYLIDCYIRKLNRR